MNPTRRTFQPAAVASAVLALPSSGAARTRALRTQRPSDSVVDAVEASRPPFGVSRTSHYQPAPGLPGTRRAQGSAIRCRSSEYVG